MKIETEKAVVVAVPAANQRSMTDRRLKLGDIIEVCGLCCMADDVVKINGKRTRRETPIEFKHFVTAEEYQRMTARLSLLIERNPSKGTKGRREWLKLADKLSKIDVHLTDAAMKKLLS